MKEKSIIDMIIDNHENGYLKEDFHLPDENPEEEIKWSEGALDGVYIYHMAHEPVTDEQRETMCRVFELVSHDRDDEAINILYDLSKDLRAIAAIDELQNLLIARQSEYDSEKMFQFGLRLFVCASKRELVKYGLSILELFDTEHFSTEFKDLVKMAALCDEFTLFAMFIFLQWENANQILFQLGQRVHGWGKVHVMERIMPDTEEIKQWILDNGIDNDIEPAYSALLCYEKAGVADLLNTEMTYNDYHSAGRILQAMLYEGPVPGISKVDNREEVLTLFLDKAKSYTLTFNDYLIIEDILDYALNEDSCYPEMVEKCSALLHTEKCEDVVRKAVESGRGISLAKKLGIDYQESYFQYYKEHVKDEYFDVADAFDERYEDAVVEVFRENLDLQEMAKGADVKIPIWEQLDDYLRLDSCLGLLQRMPGKGKDFVLAGLNSPTLRNRNSALNVLESWREITGLSIEEMDPEFWDKLPYIAAKEPDRDIKMRILLIME